MTTAPYWRALRFYSKPWLERHGADMVTMLLDASENGEQPLSGAGRRSLMWSGLRQRFASSPYVWLWMAATLVSLGLHEWAGYRNLQEAQRRNVSGWEADRLLLTLSLTTAALFVACLTILTVSLLHRPPFPRRADVPGNRGWPGWIVFAVGAMSLLGLPLVAVSLGMGVRGYRVAGGTEFQLLAVLSAITLAVQVLVVLPVVNLLFFM